MGLGGCGDEGDLVSSADEGASWSCRTRLTSPESASFSLLSWTMRPSGSAAACGVDGVSLVAFICLPASSETLADSETSDAGRSEVGGTASLAELVLDGAPLGLCAPPDCGAWISLSKRASTCGCNSKHSISFSKRIASSREVLACNSGSRSSSCLQASAVASDAGGSEVGVTASLAELVSDGAPFRLCAAADFSRWLRLSTRASSCGFSLGHLSSLSKRIAASAEGFARSLARRSSSCLQASSSVDEVDLGGDAASLPKGVSDAARFSLDEAVDPEGSLRPSRRVCNCGHNCMHRISPTKRRPSSKEGLARSRASRSPSCLQIASCGLDRAASKPSSPGAA